jgi:trans-aconitate 2-methyltransferase
VALQPFGEQNADLIENTGGGGIKLRYSLLPQMTEWDAAEYSRQSSLQEAMAQEIIALLDLKGSERILDVGCGDGKITAEIASRASKGSVLGVDPSRDMISFAQKHYGPALKPNLRFQVADARRLPFQNEFDLVVSFNALHWVPEQEAALSSIRAALISGGNAQLRLVPAGARKSLENVVEETRQTSRWKACFQDFRDPYLHLTPEQYAAMTERSGFRVLQVSTKDHAWDFGSRAAFSAFCAVGCVAWTSRLPEAERAHFINDVLSRYRVVAADCSGEENTFKFYQMDISLLAT